MKASKLSLKTARKTPNLGGRIVQNGVKLQPSGFKGSALPSPSSSVSSLCSSCRQIISDKSQKASFRPERKERAGGGDKLNKGRTLQIRGELRNSSSVKAFLHKFSDSPPKAAYKLVCWLHSLALLKLGVDTLHG